MFEKVKTEGLEIPADSQGDYRPPEKNLFSNLRASARETEERGNRLSACIGPTHNFNQEKEVDEK